MLSFHGELTLAVCQVPSSHCLSPPPQQGEKTRWKTNGLRKRQFNIEKQRPYRRREKQSSFSTSHQHVMSSPFLVNNASLHTVVASDDKCLNKRHTSLHPSSFLLYFTAEYDAIWDGISFVLIWVRWLCPMSLPKLLPSPAYWPLE